MFIKFISVLFLAFLIFFHSTAGVLAAEPPVFPSCANAQGTIKASYPDGVHGIPGKPDVFIGSDNVFLVTADTALQCFCPKEGQTGIQTNWWKIPQLTEDEINIFVKQGWVFVSDGSLWGLDSVPYLAFNIEFSCKAPGNGGGGGGSSSGGGSLSGESLGVGGGFMYFGGEVLGLASTGNILTIIQLFLAGFIAIISGILIRKRFQK